MASLLKPNRVEEMLEKWNVKIPGLLKELPVMINHHPGAAIFIFIFTLVASIPFAVFSFFAVGSFVFMLISFVIVEGTLLALGTCVLVPVLFIATIAAFSVTVTLGTSWFVITRWREIVDECQQFLDNQVKHLTSSKEE